MKEIRKATLTDGREVEYVVDPDKMMEGGMRQVFFTPDRSSVLCLFRDPSDPIRQARLEALVGKYNPTTGPHGEFWKNLFCWPTGIVQQPRLGFVCPVIPGNFFFQEGPWKGEEKEGTWFLGRTGAGKLFRDLLPELERGTWIDYFRICLGLARAIWRLHSAGLAHSDLSPKTVLIDPSRGQCLVLGWEDLVVPGFFPPDVLGTPGYIAPEVLATCHLPLKDPSRKHPCTATDQYALAVLIYQYLLFRHPLKGPKINSTTSAEEDDLLSLGAKALFVEHPSDHSNRPSDKELGVTYDALGPHLMALFNETFVHGLHAPSRRPIAAQWTDALLKTWDLLFPCQSPSCKHKWFVLHQKGGARCPFCKTSVRGTIYRMSFRREARAGTWLPDGELVIYHGLPIFKWHVYDNVKPNESLSDADREPLADCQFYGGRWLLINRKLQNVVSPGGNRVAPNSAVELKPGARFRLSTEPHGRIAEVEVIQP